MIYRTGFEQPAQAREAESCAPTLQFLINFVAIQTEDVEKP